MLVLVKLNIWNFRAVRLPAVYHPSRDHRFQPVLPGFQRAITVSVIQVIGVAPCRDHLDHIETAVRAVFVDNGVFTLDDFDLRLEVVIGQSGRGWRGIVGWRWWNIGQRL